MDDENISQDITEDAAQDTSADTPDDITESAPEDLCEPSQIIEKTRIDEESIDAAFSKHMNQYIGKTVTVYTTSGGLAGCGITGVLLDCTKSFIRLITHVGPAPQMPNIKACKKCPYYKSCLEIVEKIQSVGSIAEIPLHSLVVFIHNSL